ncbi:Glycosyltransferase [Ignavibacterium album JCM 16511]|uniref:Glycosyltransferase n=1 Tax=Ignavibacterium album (strain DSM 19864 / JCM 16511 / NBRC 101810 / Mat9-16) TaxID=945713 RepID=I0AG19_IGNAJ|nr:DUF4922 domain-containing protein [Ignavibacterium album]AFH47926.1 Glycosyltransferase [Ignavibacterium album JCM 16511]
MNHRVYDNEILNELISKNEIADASKYLFELQCNDWKLCRDNYEQLKNVRVKKFQFEGYSIKAQFNPGRIISTSAKVDPKSIQERKCFLCEENLPAEQKGILHKDEYIILINPYPIFPIHFTLTHTKHQQQRIFDTFTDLLDFSKDLSKHFTVIYNGPRCGASAPDHLHFQAGNKFFMPIDDEADLIANEYGSIVVDTEDLLIQTVDDGLRKFILLESIGKNLLVDSFAKFYKIYSELMNETDEPLMNIVSFYDSEFGWRVIIFLRAKHRSHHYFEEGENKLLVSPAAIDLGGVCIFPREEDFNRIDKELIKAIFNEVFINKTKLDELNNSLKKLF